MTVAVKVTGDGSIDSHIFENWRERRHPVLPLIQSLNCVTPVPVGGQRFVSWERWKPVAIGEAQDILQCRIRLLNGNQVKQTHPLDGGRRGVDPRVLKPRAVVNGMSNTEPECPSSGPASPARKPDVSHVGGVVARSDVGMRWRKYR